MARLVTICPLDRQGRQWLPEKAPVGVIVGPMGEVACVLANGKVAGLHACGGCGGSSRGVRS